MKICTVYGHVPRVILHYCIWSCTKSDITLLWSVCYQVVHVATSMGRSWPAHV